MCACVYCACVDVCVCVCVYVCRVVDVGKANIGLQFVGLHSLQGRRKWPAVALNIACVRRRLYMQNYCAFGRFASIQIRKFAGHVLDSQLQLRAARGFPAGQYVEWLYAYKQN